MGCVCQGEGDTYSDGVESVSCLVEGTDVGRGAVTVVPWVHCVKSLSECEGEDVCE